MQRKVTEAEFWKAFNETKAAYRVLDSDTCSWKSAETGGTVPSGLAPGFASCKAHLDESFALRAASHSSTATTVEPSKGTKSSSCDPASVRLETSPQWQHEEGFWVGDYSLYGADGKPSTSASWNYPYGELPQPVLVTSERCYLPFPPA